MRKQAKKGFTLIEAVIAVMLVGIAFTVLTQSFVNILLTLDSLKSKPSREYDIRFVRSQIIQEPDLSELEQGGSIETLSLGEAEWEVEVEPTEVVDLFRVQLEINFENPDGEDSFLHEEILLLLRPSWSDPIDRSTLITDRKDEVLDQAAQRDW